LEEQSLAMRPLFFYIFKSGGSTYENIYLITRIFVFLTYSLVYNKELTKSIIHIKILGIIFKKVLIINGFYIGLM